jgi:hypothetical protein
MLKVDTRDVLSVATSLPSVKINICCVGCWTVRNEADLGQCGHR